MQASEILEKNIMFALKRAGLNRKNAADRLDLDPSYFNRMVKTGRWQIVHLEALAKLLDVPLWQLFFPDFEMLKEKECASPGMLAHHTGTSPPFAIDLNQYVEVPVVKLQLMLGGRACLPSENLGVMYIKEDMIRGLSPGRTPSAVELGVIVAGDRGNRCRHTNSYPYRLGKNPHRSGVGGNPLLKAKLFQIDAHLPT